MSDPDAGAAAKAKLREVMNLLYKCDDMSTWDPYGMHGSHERAVAMHRGYLHAWTAKLDALQAVQAAGAGPSPEVVQAEIDRVKAHIADDKRFLQKWGEIPYGEMPYRAVSNSFCYPRWRGSHDEYPTY